MPYVAQRKFVMFGQDFAPPGNAYDLPHIVPSDLVERMPHRTLSNMLTRRMIVQVESAEITTRSAIAATFDTLLESPARVPADLDADPRVEKEGNGWWTVKGKRVHGRNGVKRALAELGG